MFGDVAKGMSAVLHGRWSLSAISLRTITGSAVSRFPEEEVGEV